MTYLNKPYHFKLFKGCLPRILLNLLLNFFSLKTATRQTFFSLVDFEKILNSTHIYLRQAHETSPMKPYINKKISDSSL